VGDGEAKGPRTLIWVPIIHTQEDMGSRREAVRRRPDRPHPGTRRVGSGLPGDAPQPPGPSARGHRRDAARRARARRPLRRDKISEYNSLSQDDFDGFRSFAITVVDFSLNKYPIVNMDCPMTSIELFHKQVRPTGHFFVESGFNHLGDFKPSESLVNDCHPSEPTPKTPFNSHTGNV
jgi:hypothetical protein